MGGDVLRGGFTLLECALAGALLCITSLALLGGVSVATRIADDNARLLAADAVAWDAVWTVFNESYGDIEVGTNTVRLAEAAAPSLYLGEDGMAELTVVVDELLMRTTVAGRASTYPMKCIRADVAWGPPGRRRSLSDFHHVFVYRSSLRRTAP